MATHPAVAAGPLTADLDLRTSVGPSSAPFSDVWTIALAAGAGRRLASITGGVPKQFWRAQGTDSSLLEATLARLHPLAIPERTITVVDDGHRAFVNALGPAAPVGTIVYQPTDRGTAAGVCLPLAHVLSVSPDAIVVITPSDHGVEHADRYRAGLRQAIGRIRAGSCDLVLFGVEPTTVTTDYGWITPTIAGPQARGTFQPVAGFVEKPPLSEARRLFSSGAVWNTMVLVAKASALLQRYREHLPFLADVFTSAAELDADARKALLRDWYPSLPRTDFSRDLVARARPLFLYTWPADIGWSDLGAPERLEHWLAVQAADRRDAVAAIGRAEMHRSI